MITPFQLQHCPISLHLPPPHGWTPSLLPAGDQKEKQQQRKIKKQISYIPILHLQHLIYYLIVNLLI